MAGVARGKGHGARRNGFLGPNVRMDDACVAPAARESYGWRFVYRRMATIAYVVAAFGCVSCDPTGVFAGACRMNISGSLMRPGQNKRMRGRSGRKGPNPLTRSYESNGPDVKIRGTAQHIAEKYLQLARDAQSSGDLVMAESLLQHAEHYFRLIAAAQAAQGVPGFSRQQSEVDSDLDDDDDFSALPDRFASLAERLPPVAYPPGQQPQPYAPAPQGQPHAHYSSPSQAQPQPFEERPMPDMRVDNRPEREPRPDRGDRPAYGERPPRRHAEGRNMDGRHAEGGERPRYGQPGGFDRNGRDRRFPPPHPGAGGEVGASLPSFITAPVARPAPGEAESVENVGGEERGAAREHDGGNFHLGARRRRRPRPSMEEAGPEARRDEPAEADELPLEPDRI